MSVEDALHKGRTFLQQGDFVSAIAAYTEAIRLDPTIPKAYCDRGYAYSQKGEMDNAVRDYTEGIRLEPTIPKTYCNRGNAYAQKGEMDNAIRDYTEAIRLDPEFAIAYYNRGTPTESQATTRRQLPTAPRRFASIQQTPTHTARGASTMRRRANLTRP